MSADLSAQQPAPRQVLLFSGHRVDVPGRVPARFPAGKLDNAAAAIDAALEALAAGAGDLALTQGSAGGDLLFAEGCVRRGVALRLMQPGPEPRFVDESVRASVDGAQWVRRYLAVRALASLPPQAVPDSLPDESSLGSGPTGRFERCNRWLLETALSWGRDRFRFVCLWDGGPSGGAGGTGHMVGDVRRRGLPVIWLDARLL